MLKINKLKIADYEYSRSLDLIDVICNAKYIGNCAFEDSENMEELQLTGQPEVIPDYMCSGCRKLKKITLPDSVLQIGEYSFQYCDSLEQINIPPFVQEIGKYAFSCTGIEELILPSDVNVAPYAFQSCFRLKRLIWNEKEYHPSMIGPYCIEIIQDFTDDEREAVYGILLPELEETYVVGGDFGWVRSDTLEKALQLYQNAKDHEEFLCEEEDLFSAYYNYVEELDFN